MRITKITLHNFKAFKGRTVFEVDAPVVCFVGENNTGKTSVFKAIEFLMSGVPKAKGIEDYLNADAINENVSVEIEICGKLIDVVDAQSHKKYEKYICTEDEENRIILQRSSEVRRVQQNNKLTNITDKHIAFYNFETKQFENPAGIDKAVSGIFEIVTIWSDFKTDELMDFSSTKPLGKLTKEISQSFMQCADWGNFIDAHQQAFITGENSLANQTSKLKDDIQASLKEFYGEASINFNFEPPDASSFIKLGMVNVDDGVETCLTEKGSGMQRAYAFAVMKVYADFLSKNGSSSDVEKPLFFFIDEPEISLHPRAQQTLFKALKDISKKQQVFISTHSPFLLKNFSDDNVITYTNKKDSNNVIESVKVDSMQTFAFSPTLAEINYYAFGIISNDFHCEIYGYICLIVISDKSMSFEKWVTANGFLNRNKSWKKLNNKGVIITLDVTLSTYIRHSIHHPENTYNEPFTSDELAESTKLMLDIVNNPIFQSEVQLYRMEETE